MSNGTSWVYADFSMTNHLVGSFKYVCYGAHFQYNGMIEIQCAFLATAQKFTKLATQGWVFTAWRGYVWFSLNFELMFHVFSFQTENVIGHLTPAYSHDIHIWWKLQCSLKKSRQAPVRPPPAPRGPARPTRCWPSPKSQAGKDMVFPNGKWWV